MDIDDYEKAKETISYLREELSFIDESNPYHGIATYLGQLVHHATEITISAKGKNDTEISTPIEGKEKENERYRKNLNKSIKDNFNCAYKMGVKIMHDVNSKLTVNSKQPAILIDAENFPQLHDITTNDTKENKIPLPENEKNVSESKLDSESFKKVIETDDFEEKKDSDVKQTERESINETTTTYQEYEHQTNSICDNNQIQNIIYESPISPSQVESQLESAKNVRNQIRGAIKADKDPNQKKNYVILTSIVTIAIISFTVAYLFRLIYKNDSNEKKDKM